MRRLFQRKKKQPFSENAKSTNENKKVDNNNNTNTNNNVDANSYQEEKLSTPKPASTSTSTLAFEYTPHDELYGQIIPKETPELLSTKLKQLEIELNQIPNDSKKEYMEALKKCPTLNNKSNKSNNNNNRNDSDGEHTNEHSESHKKFKLMFLRCEVFDCTLAAKRIVKYWANSKK